MVEPTVAEAAWLDVLGQLPVWNPPGLATLIVAPHPDDETLGAGGLIAAQTSRGVAVSVAAVTDGEKAYPDMPGLPAQREGEQTNALRRLSVARERIARLRLPDGNVASFEKQLEEKLAPLIIRETLVVTPWKGDHHPDHQACGRVAEKLARQVGAPLSSYFFWTWHYGTRQELEALPVQRFMLDDELLRAKAEALLCHRSQLQHPGGEPVLPELLLQPARRPFEVFAIE
ncbi:MAG: PIG-L deacetylase family protein [Bryobacteraceae bacterium]